jgi:hypothetical protein
VPELTVQSSDRHWSAAGKACEDVRLSLSDSEVADGGIQVGTDQVSRPLEGCE